MKPILAKGIAAFFILSLFQFPVHAMENPFSDLTPEYQWAAESILSLQEKGIVRGFPDDTFRPEEAVTKEQALVFCSRFLIAGAAQAPSYLDHALTAYGDSLAGYDTEFKPEIAYLMCRKVITREDLPNYLESTVQNTPLQRYEAAVLITKLMGRASFDTPQPPMTYADASDIPERAKKYISVASTDQIMTGLDRNLFAPHQALTRAMMAVILSRAGKVTEPSAKSVIFRAYNPDTQQIQINLENETDIVWIPIPKNFFVLISGAETPVAKIPLYTKLLLRYQGVALKCAEGILGDTQYLVAGFITKIENDENGQRHIDLANQIGGEKSLKFNLADDCYITIDGGISAYSSLAKDMYLEVNIRQEMVVSILGYTTITNMREDMNGLLENLFQHYN